MTARELAARLGARRIGKDKWVALCPAHPDRRPSLSIGIGRKVPVVMKCRSAGCDTKAILAAMGLKWADVFDAALGKIDFAGIRRREGERFNAARCQNILRHMAIEKSNRFAAEAGRLAARMALHPNDSGIMARQFHRVLTASRRWATEARKLYNEPNLRMYPRPPYTWEVA